MTDRGPVDRLIAQLQELIERDRETADIWERQATEMYWPKLAGREGQRPPDMSRGAIRNWINWLKERANELEVIAREHLGEGSLPNTLNQAGSVACEPPSYLLPSPTDALAQGRPQTLRAALTDVQCFNCGGKLLEPDTSAYMLNKMKEESGVEDWRCPMCDQAKRLLAEGRPQDAPPDAKPTPPEGSQP